VTTHMNPIRERQIISRYPDFFRSHDFSFEIGEGWVGLIVKLCEDIVIIDPNPHEFYFLQIKEKFGGLRIYAHNTDQRITDLINKAEVDSLNICACCGRNAAPDFDGGWTSPLCKRCVSQSYYPF